MTHTIIQGADNGLKMSVDAELVRVECLMSVVFPPALIIHEILLPCG